MDDDIEVVRYILQFHHFLRVGKFVEALLEPCDRFMNHDLEHFLSVCGEYEKRYLDADVNVVSLVLRLLTHKQITDYTTISALCAHLIKYGETNPGLCTGINELMVSRWVLNTIPFSCRTASIKCMRAEIRNKCARWALYMPILISLHTTEASCQAHHKHGIFCGNCLVLAYASLDARSVLFKNQRAIDFHNSAKFDESLQQYYDEIREGHDMFRKLDALPAELIEYIIDLTKFDCCAFY